MKNSSPEEQLAWEVQQRTYPRSIPPIDGFDVYGKTVPAGICNGDFYDSFGVAKIGFEKGFIFDESDELSDMGLLLGDAVGHGMAAALMATELRSLIRAAIRLGVHYRRLCFLINKQLCEDLDDGHFVTLMIGRLNADESYYRWLSFGHAPILFYRAADAQVIEYSPILPPLGLSSELEAYEPVKTIFEPGDMLVVLSDGFGETFDPEKNILGVEPFKLLLKERAHEPLEQLSEAFWDTARAHQQDGETRDDRTVLMIRRHEE